MGAVAGPPTNTVTGDPWASAVLRPGSPYVTNVVSPLERRLPPYRGPGYIAGDAPDGLVTFNGTGAVRTLDLFDRETNTYVGSTVSDADGTYRFDSLNLERRFDVRARGSSATEADLIVAQVKPYVAPLDIVGSFPDVSLYKPYFQTLPIVGGVPPYSGPTITSGSIPSEMTLRISGSVLILDGTVQSTGSFEVDFTVNSSDGQTLAASQSFDVVDSGSYRFWRCYITANGGASDGYTSIQEMQFFGSDSLVLPIAGTADSSFPNQGPDKAFDGNTTSVSASWASGTGIAVPHWLAYEFASDLAPASLSLYPQAGTQYLARAPVDFIIQFSGDGTSWHDLLSVTGESGWAVNVAKTYAL